MATRAVAALRRVTSGVGFGIDIGGSGIKGAPVDLGRGEFRADRLRIPTPQPSTPDAVAAAVRGILTPFGRRSGTRPIGVTFPAVIQHGVARTAANVDRSWIGTDVDALLTERLGRPVAVVNDADAAGLAESRYGAAKGVDGVVFMATLGTGIGSALIVDGEVVPNTEFGHIEVGGKDAETRAADSARERDDLTWEQWAKRLQRYFTAIEDLLWPDLIVVGGGVSRKAEKYLPLLTLRTPIVAATLLNDGGIIGAALHAAEHA
jgi:polyphosphate glucokinase